MLTGNSPETPNIEIVERTRCVKIRGNIVEDMRQVALGGYQDNVVNDEDVLTLVGVAEDARLGEGQQLNLPAPTVKLVGETATKLLENYDKRKTRIARFLGRMSFTAHSAKHVKNRIAPIEQDLIRLAEMPPEVAPERDDDDCPQMMSEFMVAAEVANQIPDSDSADNDPVGHYVHATTY